MKTRAGPLSTAPVISSELHLGISDYLTAVHDGTQEAPPRHTNAGSAHRITSLPLFPLVNLHNISHSASLLTSILLLPVSAL